MAVIVEPNGWGFASSFPSGAKNWKTGEPIPHRPSRCTKDTRHLAASTVVGPDLQPVSGTEDFEETANDVTCRRAPDNPKVGAHSMLGPPPTRRNPNPQPVQNQAH